MRYRRLGRTGLEVSEVGFGAWGIGGGMWKGSDDAQALRALHEAVEQGINFFDTALAYGNGHSEQLIGRLLQETSSQVHVATKIPPKNLRWPAEGALSDAFPASYIVDCTERSLRNLQVDCVDLIQLHVWSPEWVDEKEWLYTLRELQSQGKIRHFGVSINDHQPDSALEVVRRGLVDAVQVIFNIFDQTPARELFPLCREKDVGVIVRVPFDEGALTGQITSETKFSRRDWRSRYFRGERTGRVEKRVRALLDDLGIELERLPEVALRFCLHPPAVSSVIAGMRRTRHVRANAAASEAPPLSDQQLEILSRHGWDKNFYA